MSIAGASDSNPIAISARGGEEVRRLLTMIIKSFRLTEYEAKAVLVDGTRAAVHWRANIHSRITGSSSSTEFLTLLEFEGAHITGYTELFVRRQG